MSSSFFTEHILFISAIIAVGVFHILWYALSCIITRGNLPGKDTIKAFQDQNYESLQIDLEPAAIKEEYIHSHGFKIHMDILEHGKDSPTLVFIPGTSVYAKIYIEFMYGIYKAGFNVVGFDPRGHGLSSGPRGDYSIDGIVDDALVVVKYARKKFGDKIAIAGSSQGGMAAFYTAARDDSIAAAVCHNLADLNGKDNLILSTFKIPRWSSPIAGIIMNIYKKFIIPISTYLDLSKETLKDGTDAASFIAKDPLCITWITFKTMGSLLKTKMARPVENISVPIMLIHSGKDNIFPQEYVENIFNRLTCKKEYLLLKEREHLVMTNNVPEVIGPVVKWLKTCL